MRQLTSKLIAGGLSAGAVLLWWPHVFPTEGPLSWAIRGVIWTLLVELLLMALIPLEDVLWDHTRAGRAASDRAQRAKQRVIGTDSPRRRIASAALVATFVLMVPLGLIFQGEPVIADTKPDVQRVEVTKVVRVTEPVKVKRVIERVEVPGPAHPQDRAEPLPQQERPTAKPTKPAKSERVAPERRDKTTPQRKPVAEKPSGSVEPTVEKGSPTPTPQPDNTPLGEPAVPTVTPTPAPDPAVR